MIEHNTWGNFPDHLEIRKGQHPNWMANDLIKATIGERLSFMNWCMQLGALHYRKGDALHAKRSYGTGQRMEEFHEIRERT